MKGEIEKLRREDATVYRAMSEYRYGNCTYEEALEKALIALCDMVGQHCSRSGETNNGASVIYDPLYSAGDEALGVLVQHGYVEKIDDYRWAFTRKAGVWGANDG